MIVVLGDLHLSSAKDYFIKIAEEFLKWFSTWSQNAPENELIFAGDLVHSSVNGGLVIDIIEKIVAASRFNKIHIVPGNHDLKRRDGVIQLAYEFLRNKSNVVIYDRITVAEIQNHKILMMPHYIAEPNEPFMKESYSNAYKSYTDSYDMLVGHFMENSIFYGGADSIENLDKLNVKHICLGHIHTRVNPKIYIGSVYASKVNESDDTRAAWILDKGIVREEKLPTFSSYIAVTYPDKLPETEALVPIYTITNCANDRIAKAFYGENIFIRKVMQSLSIPGRKDLDLEKVDLKELDIVAMFKEFTKTQDPPLNRTVATTCVSLLKMSTNLGV